MTVHHIEKKSPPIREARITLLLRNLRRSYLLKRVHATSGLVVGCSARTKIGFVMYTQLFIVIPLCRDARWCQRIIKRLDSRSYGRGTTYQSSKNGLSRPLSFPDVEPTASLPKNGTRLDRAASGFAARIHIMLKPGTRNTKTDATARFAKTRRSPNHTLDLSEVNVMMNLMDNPIRNQLSRARA